MSTRRKRESAATILVGGLLIVTSSSQAQNQSENFSGAFSVGVRSVDVDGSEHKFSEDINLEDGPRLFDLRFVYSPGEEGTDLVDLIEADVSNLGGDPFESVHLGVRKFGSFNFKFDRRTSEYFYDDILVPPALASIEGSTGGDFHRFDFERVRDTAELGIDLSPAAKLRFGMERFTKTGVSETTLDLQRDEFEIEKPIDESLNAYTIGFQYAWDKITLVLEESIRDFENSTELFLPGFSVGENPANLTELDFFFLDQSYDYDSLQHTARILARPTARLELNFAVSYQDLDLDMDATETSQGVDFTGAPFTTDVAGPADVGRDMELYDLDLRYLINDRLQLVGSFRQHALDQQGAVAFGLDSGSSVWDMETTGLEAGVAFAVSSDLTITAGWGNEQRDTVIGTDTGSGRVFEREEQERDGFFARLDYSPSAAVELKGSLEDNSFDDPFTLASPTDGRRYRVQGRYAWENGLSINGSYQMTDYENANSGWDSGSTQADLRLAYGAERVQASLGYGLIDLDRSISQLVTGGFRQDLFAIDYSAEADFTDGSVRWRLTDRVSAGGYFRRYENAGSFPLERDDLKGFVEIGFGTNYLVNLSYRTIDYDEDDFDDYDADIIELAIGYRWQ